MSHSTRITTRRTNTFLQFDYFVLKRVLGWYNEQTLREIDNKVLRMIPMDTTNNQKQREKNTL